MKTKNSEILLQVDSVSKRFPGVVALDGVSLHLKHGEVLSVIGENGAGKSTLMKILAGIQPPDQGQIRINGKIEEVDSVQRASELGIALIHQELYLCENLDVGANIFLGREPRRMGMIDRQRIRSESAKFLKQVGLETTPDRLAGSLTIGQQQMVEIAKAISTDARIVIMDEPTSSLSQKETENLFVIIRRLKDQGIGVIYISHRLGEVEELSDRVVVLRDGKNAGELTREEINHQAMVSKMVGRDLSEFYVRQPSRTENVTLSVKDLRTYRFPKCELNFEINSGEIVGIAGLVGAGRTELLTSLFGVTPPLGGTISVDGAPVTLANCRAAIKHGIALVPEDRKLQGVVLEMTVRENTSLPTLKDDSKLGLIDFLRDQELADEMRLKLGIKTPSTEQTVKFLSGGNQQKVVIAKWLALSPGILLMDEPTRGIDVGAKREIYKLMDELAHSGVAVLFVSSDMEEVIGMADRIIVMHEGRITGQVQKDAFSEEIIMNLATGVTDVPKVASAI